MFISPRVQTVVQIVKPKYFSSRTPIGNIPLTSKRPQGANGANGVYIPNLSGEVLKELKNIFG